MALDLKITQSARLDQRLVMTPQLQQAIKILQLSLPELEAVVQSELESNPLLEMVEERSPTATAADDGMAAAPDPTPGSEPDLLPPEPEPGVTAAEPEWNGNGDEQPTVEGVTTEARDATLEIKEDGRLDKLDWREYLENYSNNWQDNQESEQDDERRQALENTLTRRTSLEEHLMWQLRMSSLEHNDQIIGATIIYNLNDDGYLETMVEDLARQLETDPAGVERVLKRVQRFDPPGVAARDLRECLYQQLSNIGMEESLAARIVLNHLDLLEKHRYAEIARALGVAMEMVGQAAKVISLLEPKPGRDYGGQEPAYIVPDVFIHKMGDDYVVLQGLHAGEKIVTSANFLIDSESQLQAAMGSFAPQPPAVGAAAAINTAGSAANIEFTTDPSPPHRGNNTFRVKLMDSGGAPVLGAQITVTFFMPAMPAMGMGAMRVVSNLSDKGGGLYEGRGELESGGTWQVTVVAQKNGQTLASKQLSVNAQGAM